MPLNSSRYSPVSTVTAAGPTVGTAAEISANLGDQVASVGGSVQVSGVFILLVVVLVVVMARAFGG